MVASQPPHRTSADLSSFGLEDAPLRPLNVPDLDASDSLQVLTTQDEVAAATLAVTGMAQRLVSIFTPDLEPALYSSTSFLETIKRLVLGHRFARVRVLVRDHSALISQPTQLVTLARRLTTHVEMRLRAPAYRDMQAGYCIADDRAIVYRLRADSYEGIAAHKSPAIARQYLEEFERIWQASAPDAEQRALSL
ncbi:MAG: hypothetical protein QM718_01630 [Steroidobacteraceae bacterium]